MPPRRPLVAVAGVILGLAAAAALGAGGDGPGPRPPAPPTALPVDVPAPPRPATTVAVAPAGLVDGAVRATVAAGTARFSTAMLFLGTDPPAVQYLLEGEVDLRSRRGVRRDRAGERVAGGRVVLGDPGPLVDVAAGWLDGDRSLEQDVDGAERGPVRPVSSGLGSFLGLWGGDEGPATAEESLADVFAGYPFGLVGDDVVRGAPAVRYRAERFLDPGSEVVGLWLDGAGRIVRATQEQTTYYGATFLVVAELYDLGSPLDIPPPPPVED